MIRVLQAAADAFGWKPAAASSGRGVGIACSIDAGTYIATMAELAVDPSHGTVEVRRIVCAQDMVIVVNPDGSKMQMEGAITMGLGYALAEELRFRGGEILVLEGVFRDEDGDYPTGTWLRNPRWSRHTPFTGPEGALIYVKVGAIGADFMGIGT